MIAQLIRVITGVRAIWMGDEPPTITEKTQCVFFSNHCSHLDAPVIWAALPKVLRRHARPVAAADYWNATATRRWLATKVFRAVLIERQRVSRSRNPLRAIIDVLEQGESVIIFPEGTRRGGDGRGLGQFKPGLFHIARKHPETALIPIYLENLNRILPKGEFILVPFIAVARFGPPIYLLPGEDRRAFLDRARTAIERMSVPAGEQSKTIEAAPVSACAEKT